MTEKGILRRVSVPVTIFKISDFKEANIKFINVQGCEKVLKPISAYTESTE
jgi:hypothetical protein